VLDKLFNCGNKDASVLRPDLVKIACGTLNDVTQASVYPSAVNIDDAQTYKVANEEGALLDGDVASVGKNDLVL
jgi:hypothetical protein